MEAFLVIAGLALGLMATAVVVGIIILACSDAGDDPSAGADAYGPYSRIFPDEIKRWMATGYTHVQYLWKQAVMGGGWIEFGRILYRAGGECEVTIGIVANIGKGFSGMIDNAADVFAETVPCEELYTVLFRVCGIMPSLAEKFPWS